MSKYRIRSVAQMTGLSAALIRAWEARYGLVEPVRTSAGYRLYSDEDVAVLSGAQRLVQQGIAPMQVARLPRQRLLADGAEATAHQAPVLSALSADGGFEGLMEPLMAAFSRFDSQQAEELLGRVMVALSPRDAGQRFLIPLLREIGDRWHRGELTIAAEHFGSSLIRRKLQGLLDMLRGRSGARRVLLACPEGEFHDAGLGMFAIEAALQGWEPIYLGANLPLVELTRTVHEVRPDLVALSMVVKRSAGELRSLLTEAHSQFGSVCPIVVGGQGIAGLEGVVLMAGCHVAPRSGRLDELLPQSKAPASRRAAARRDS